MDSFIRDLIVRNDLSRHPLGSIFLTVVVIWSLAWKGFALWHAAQDRQKYWFIAILILNTAGILEIAYLFVFSPNKLDLKSTIKAAQSIKIPKLSKK